MNAKEILRKKADAERNAMSPEQIRGASLLVQERVVALDRFGQAESVFCYIATDREVETSGIIAKCHETGKKVFVPAYDSTRREYGITVISRDTEWRIGCFKIPEPVEPVWMEDWGGASFLCVVPGVAFGKNCARVGHGKGIYDRLLNRLGNCFKTGLAFECQVFETAPVASHDVMMDVVVTECNIYIKQ